MNEEHCTNVTRDMTWLFPVCVLETPLGPLWCRYGEEVEKERANLAALYEKKRADHPWWSFTKASYEARAEWLYDYVLSVYIAGGDGHARPPEGKPVIPPPPPPKERT